jgi:CHAT domain-containing protein
VTDLRSQLPDTVALLSSVVLRDRLFISIITKAGVEHVERSIASSALEKMVTSFHEQLLLGRAAVDSSEVARQLYDALVAPVEARIPPRADLYVVADDELSMLPFGALRNHRTDRLLIEDHAIALTPSLNLLRASSKLVARDDGAPDSATVIASTDAARFEAEGLPSLPNAEREARTVASLYGTSTLLDSDTATKNRILRELTGSEVIHMAGHAVVNGQLPMLSRFVVTPEDGEESSGSLFAQDIGRLQLKRARVVVLAACRTGVGPVYRGEGVMSLGRAFLAAGAANLVATLWDVEDQPTARLVTAFHRHLRTGVEPVRALHDAQLELLSSSDSLERGARVWAAFTITATSMTPSVAASAARTN